jgi:osmotically-inducible protein OsmY
VLLLSNSQAPHLAQTQGAIMLENAHSSAPVLAAVAAELDWDPKVDSRDISVTADRGAVTLRGTAGSLRQVREAQQAARRVHGVTSVWNRLTVRPVISGHTEDCEVCTAVLHALMLNSGIPATVDAKVENGVVRLTGTATWHWQRDEAESACAAVAGVLGVVDDIELIPEPADADIQLAIMAAFRRHAPLVLHDLSVDVLTSGVVILSGTVTTWAEHDQAVAAGWSSRGVVRVDDRIVIMS